MNARLYKQISIIFFFIFTVPLLSAQTNQDSIDNPEEYEIIEEDNDIFKNELSARIFELDKKIGRAESEAKKRMGENTDSFIAALKEVEMKRETLQARLTQYQDPFSINEDVKRELLRSYFNLEKSYKQLVSVLTDYNKI